MPVWAIVVGVGIGLCVLAVVCIILAGPAIGNPIRERFASFACQHAHGASSGSAAMCDDWADGLPQQYPKAFDVCSRSVASNGSGDEATRAYYIAYYNCLIDQGVPPPQ